MAGAAAAAALQSRRGRRPPVMKRCSRQQRRSRSGVPRRRCSVVRRPGGPRSPALPPRRRPRLRFMALRLPRPARQLRTFVTMPVSPEINVAPGSALHSWARALYPGHAALGEATLALLRFATNGVPKLLGRVPSMDVGQVARAFAALARIPASRGQRRSTATPGRSKAWAPQCSRRVSHTWLHGRPRRRATLLCRAPPPVSRRRRARLL